MSGDLNVLVATTALGMGYDNPQIGFVVHYQSPGSVVHYYQQVGRSGRALSSSFGVLLRGREDQDIVDWFIASAFPSEDQVTSVLRALQSSDEPMSIVELASAVNIPHRQIENALKQLDVEGVVRRISGVRYERTLKAWVYPGQHVDAVAAIRRDEHEEMRAYGNISGCRMPSWFERSMIRCSPAAAYATTVVGCRGQGRSIRRWFRKPTSTSTCASAP